MIAPNAEILQEGKLTFHLNSRIIGLTHLNFNQFRE
jgi:hypothetical protein